MFSLIIINYRTKEITAACLDSVFKNCRGDFEIIVVDNNSGDGSVSFLQEKFGAKIKIIANEENAGFGRANNQAAKIAQGDYLFFLNSDTLVEEDIFPLLKVCFANPGAGIAAPRLILPGGSPQEYAGGRLPDFFSALTRRREKNPKLEWVSGAALAVRKDVFEKVGGFDENYFMYFEDIDLCWRIKLAGYEAVLADSAKVIHFGGKSLTENRERKKFYYKSQDYFFRKYFGYWPAIILRLARSVYNFFNKY
jgi:GT2 family glycosyltransferase